MGGAPGDKAARTLVRTADAETDLLQIWLHIGRDNEPAATALLRRLDAVCETIADNPLIGPARADIAPKMRYLPVEQYLIPYQPIAGGIEIVRILHGARDVRRILDPQK